MLDDINKEHTFYLDTIGQKTKKKFRGDFNVKCVLKNRETIDIAVATDRYNGGSTTLAPQYALLNRAIAELEVRIIDAPKWWEKSDGGRELEDTNVVFEIYQQALNTEKEWAKRITEKAEKAEKDAQKAEEKEKSTEPSE